MLFFINSLQVSQNLRYGGWILIPFFLFSPCRSVEIGVNHLIELRTRTKISVSLFVGKACPHPVFISPLDHPGSPRIILFMEFIIAGKNSTHDLNSRLKVRCSDPTVDI